VLTPQNGMAAERIALRGFERVYGASINTPARYTRLGEIVVGGHPEPGLRVVGRFPASADLFDGPPERLQAFSQRMLQETLAVLAAMGVEPGQQSTWQSLAQPGRIAPGGLLGHVDELWQTASRLAGAQ
jgi:hypothetical protein